MNNSQFVTASLAEFISVWNHGGDASLNLTTTGGFIDISFNLHLGQPGTPFSNSPSSTPSIVGRHRGPAQKERDRQRAARHQASQTGRPTPTTATPVTSTPTTEPVSESTVSATAPGFTTPFPVVSAPVSGATPQVALSVPEVKIHKCEYCDQTFNTTKGMNIHKGRMHQDNAPTSVNAPSTSTNSPVYVPGTTYSRGAYTCPGNAPPPPPCEKCGNPTYWSCSRVRQDMGWLHEFVCLCLTRKCINTPPVS